MLDFAQTVIKNKKENEKINQNSKETENEKPNETNEETENETNKEKDIKNNQEIMKKPKISKKKKEEKKKPTFDFFTFKNDSDSLISMNKSESNNSDSNKDNVKSQIKNDNSDNQNNSALTNEMHHSQQKAQQQKGFSFNGFGVKMTENKSNFSGLLSNKTITEPPSLGMDKCIIALENINVSERDIEQELFYQPIPFFIRTSLLFFTDC